MCQQVLTRPTTERTATDNAEICEGCPRCQDPNGPWCSMPHPKFDNRHPTCRHCGHCILRGEHNDDTEDLDRHPGFPRGHGGAMGKFSVN